jgi:demethylmenaquinone methyltransferase / 2-methoxy-6-polyprenyl-1,4-benzoquinol methylase
MAARWWASTRARRCSPAPAGRASADRSFAARCELLCGEAERLPFADGSFDALTFTYLLRYVDDPAAVRHEMARVVKPGGRIGMVEFGVPS